MIPLNKPTNKMPASLILSSKRTIEAASYYKNQGYKIGVLNFASSINPGGGVLWGASTQEESICRISTLYPLLTDEKAAAPYYLNHRQWIHEGTMGRKNRDDCIYSPDVLVFREDSLDCSILPENEWFNVDVLTCAAPDQRFDPGGAMYQPTDEQLLEDMKKRIEHILKVAAYQDIEVLILGAFGCGAFGNPAPIIAKAFEEVLSNYLYQFRIIEFAVYSRSIEDRNFKAFAGINGINIIDDTGDKSSKSYELSEELQDIDWSAIEKTVDMILLETSISLDDCVMGTQWISDDSLKKDLARKAVAFGGGVRGLVSYKRYKYALKYVQPETKEMRYRYVAAAIIMIGNGFYGSDYNSYDVTKSYQKCLSIHLSHHIPSGDDGFLDIIGISDSIIKKLQDYYKSYGSVESLTVLKVLKALEWDEERIKSLSDLIKYNRFL